MIYQLNLVDNNRQVSFHKKKPRDFYPGLFVCDTYLFTNNHFFNK
jgi:hypothetical protein